MGRCVPPFYHSQVFNLQRQVQLVAPSDIAIYATLCALASLSRSAVKATLVDNEPFGYILEQEPYVREILDAYMNSKFQVMLALLNKHSVSLCCLICPFLMAHIYPPFDSC
jgi:hypothetical protein